MSGADTNAPVTENVTKSTSSGAGVRQVVPRVARRTMAANGVNRVRKLCLASTFANATLSMAQDLLRELQGHFDRFELECFGAGTMTLEEFETQQTLMVQIEQAAREARMIIQGRIDALAPVPPQRPSPDRRPVQVEVMATDLPTNQNTWDKFDGDLFRWQSFRDKFRAAVHQNDRISTVFKLQHLLAALTGQAAEVVGTRPPTEAGYNEAWIRLCEVFDDEYMLVRAILKTIFSLSALEQPTQEGLRKIIDTMHEAIRQLTTLKVPVEHWDQILVFMMVEKLDSRTMDAWEMYREQGLPTFGALTIFLERRARSLTHAKTGPQSSGSKRKSSDDHQRTGSSQGKFQRKIGSSTTPNEGWSCPNCRQGHPLYRCPGYLAMNLIKRQEAVRSWRLCFNCLKSGHGQATCPFRACGRCPNEQKHNSSLCPKGAVNNAAIVSRKPKPLKAAKK